MSFFPQSLSAAKPANRSRLNTSCLALQQHMETTPISCDSPVCRNERLPISTPKGVLKPDDQTPLAATAGEFYQPRDQNSGDLRRVYLFEGEVSCEFDVISKPQNVCLSAETKR